VAVSALVALTACAPAVQRSSAGDVRRVEEEIAEDLQYQSGDPYVDVSCERFRMRRGDEFECQAVDGYGDRYDLIGYVEDDDGSYSWEVL
jgi:hypothetical protein